MREGGVNVVGEFEICEGGHHRSGLLVDIALGPHPAQDDRKSVDPHAGDGVFCAKEFSERVRHQPQYSIAGFGAAAFAGGVEAIELEHHQGKVLLLALGACDGLPQTIFEQDVVGETRGGISYRVVDALALGEDDRVEGLAAMMPFDGASNQAGHALAFDPILDHVLLDPTFRGRHGETAISIAGQHDDRQSL